MIKTLLGQDVGKTDEYIQQREYSFTWNDNVDVAKESWVKVSLYGLISISQRDIEMHAKVEKTLLAWKKSK